MVDSNRARAARALAAWLVVALPLVGVAQGLGEAKDEANKPKTGISGILGKLDWLASDVEVLDELKGALDAEYREKMKAVRDTFKIDRLMREKRKRFKEMKETLVRFDGQRTGYETSLIAQDYLPNAGESVLRVDDSAAQRYYFFKHGRLWKVVVAYHSNVTRAINFQGFMKQVAKKYGKPASTQKGKQADGTKGLISAVWEDEITQLTVENRTGFFGTYVMKFIAKSEGLAYEAERADRKLEPENTAGDAKADALMADIAGGPAGDSGEDVVDRITGVEHDVDLNAGRPVNAPLVRARNAPARPRPQLDQPTTSEEPSPSPAAGRKPKRTGRGDEAKALDEPAPASGGGDVIIY